MINWRKFFKKVLRKAFSILTVFAVIFSSLGPVVQVNKADAAPIATSAAAGLVNPNQTIKAPSFTVPVLGLNLANSPARILNSVQIKIAGSEGFNPANDLAALANDATSGVALYADGAVAGEDGVFGAGNGDAVVPLTSAVNNTGAGTLLSQLTPASTGTYTINGTSNTTSPALVVGDIIFKQSGAGAGSWGMVTTALAAGAFSVDGTAVSNADYKISKIGGGAGNTVNITTGAVGANPWTVNSGTYSPVLGDIVLYQTGTSPAAWGVVTNATNTNQNTFSINGANLAPATSYQITKISSYTPATSAVDATVPGKLTGGLNFALGDLVFGDYGSGYGWSVVTTAENVVATDMVSALRVNGGVSAPVFLTSTQVSKITASGKDLVTSATPVIAAGDVIFASPAFNANPPGMYNWHLATTGGNGPAGSSLRLDGASSVPFWPWVITLTPASAPTIPADDTTAGNAGNDFYVVVKTSVGATNNRQFIAILGSNNDIGISGGDTVNIGGLPIFTNSLTIDTTAPSNPSAPDYQIIQNQPGVQDQITVRPGVSVGAAGDTAKIYANDGTTLLGQGVLGGTPVQFAPINIGDNANASVKVEFVDSAGNVSGQTAVTGNDIVAPTVASAAAFTDRIILNFSENMDGMAASNCANYTINGSVLSCTGPGTPFIDFQGNKSTIRGLSLVSPSTATLVIAGNVIRDISGGQNPLAAYTNNSLSVSNLTLPTITNINPTSGAVGASITITGTNFGAGPAGANYKVFFSGGFNPSTGPLPPIEATSFTSWSATSIVVTVPAGAQGGPVNVMVNGVMSDMSSYSFFDIAGSYTAKVYYSADTSALMPDDDANNIRIVTAGPSGPVVHWVGGAGANAMTYDAPSDTFTIAGVSSMGWVWGYDVTGTRLNASGREINISSTQNLNMVATTRKISGTLTVGASCTAGGQNKNLVVFAMPDVVDSGAAGFKEVEPAFFVTNGSCVASYSIAVPINGTYRVEAHVPPEMSGSSVVSSQYTDPSALLVTITDAAQAATNKNFLFPAATHKITGHVQKPSGSFGTEEKGMLWIFAYQPKEGGKGTGTQVDTNGDFTVYVTAGVWKVGVGGPNMPYPVEIQVDVDDTYLIGSYTAGVKNIVIAPPSDFIEGYAKDAAGNGLANTSIYAWREGGPGGGNAKTDSQGYYKMYVTPGDNYHVGAHSQSFGFLGEQSGITVTTTSHPTVNFTVSSANNYTISGVITKGGVGLQQAFVFVTEGDNGPMMGGGGTDASGVYSIKVSGGANRYLHVGLPGKGEIYTENLGTISANISNKDIAINSSTIIVKISPASAVSQAFVGANSDQGGGFSDTNVSTDPNVKEYHIEVPRPASGTRTYYIEGGVSGYGPLAQVSIGVTSAGAFVETSVTPNDGIIEYALSDLYTVSGAVTGTNTTDAWVWAAGPNGGGGGSVSGGTYSFKLRNGTYDLGVSKPGYIGNKISITVSGAALPNQDLVLSSAAQTITGSVYLPDGTTKATNAWVWAENGTGGWSGGSTNGNGDYTLNVGTGEWTVKAAYDGYNSNGRVVTAPASGVNITLIVISGFTPNTKNSPITPSEGGVMQGTGIKVDLPKNVLGTGTTAATLELKSTTNAPTRASTNLIGSTQKEITARNGNQTITTLSGTATVELTVSKAELVSEGLTLEQVRKMKVSYFDPTSGGNWVEVPTAVTLSVPGAASVSDLSDSVAVTLSGTTSHFSTFAPTLPTSGDAPPAPVSLSATAGNGSATLSWAASAGATKYDIYKKIGSDYPYLAQTTSTSYTATGLTNGTAYYFKVSALDNSNKESAATSFDAVTPAVPSSGGGGGYYTPTTLVSGASIIIASGAASATSTAVTLTLTATNAAQMAISNTSDFVGIGWETFATSKSWTLTSGDGTKTVYAKFRDAAGNASSTVSDTITLSAGAATTETSTSTPAANVTSYPDGTLLKSSDAPEVYVIKSGNKVWIKTAEEFSAAGYKWGDIKVVAGEILKSVGSISLIRVAGDPQVYVLHNNKKRHIKTAEEFNAAGYKWENIKTLNKAEVDSYAEEGVSSGKIIVITPLWLRIRALNTAKSAELGRVNKNESYSVLEENGGWYKIKTSGGITGWVSGIYVTVGAESASVSEAGSTATITIVPQYLRIRSINSAGGKILGLAKKGEVYPTLEENGGWYKIKTNTGLTGWISGIYVTKK